VVATRNDGYESFALTPPPITDNLANDDEVPIPTLPVDPMIENADSVVDANVVGDEVDKKKLPMMVRNVQWLDVSDPSESASCAPVDDAIWSAHCGVVVPIPIYPDCAMRIRSRSAVVPPVKNLSAAFGFVVDAVPIASAASEE
jgi:hypothetical protein